MYSKASIPYQSIPKQVGDHASEEKQCVNQQIS